MSELEVYTRLHRTLTKMLSNPNNKFKELTAEAILSVEIFIKSLKKSLSDSDE